ncbi:MAG TPA: PH domain-containing protein [Candidatus Eisenbacteria bacterium]|jgi:membrane protein YdbS with pleckstrin-like domain|nr:PH domain-containing protein [Candidatus Eisenbacteria bacterium]
MNVSKVIKLKDDEKVLRVVRNYGVVYAPAALFAFLLVAVSFFFMLPLFKAGWWGLAVFALLNVVGLFVALRTAMVWHWNAFIVTSSRVIDIDQRGFFSRTVSEADFDRIQDVSYSIKGMLGTLLKFGTIELQTAGNATNLELQNVHDPKELHHLITESMHLHKDKANGGARSEKIAVLLDAAAELNDSEARAFIVALQAAVASGEKGVEHAMMDEKDLEWLKRDVKEGEE